MARWSPFVVLLVLLAAAPRAEALSVTPDPAPFDFAGFLVGELDFVGMSSGVPSGGIVLDGTVAPTDISMEFTLSVTSTAIGGIPFINLGRDFPWPATVTGAGAVPGAGDDVTSATVLPGDQAAQFFFDAVDGIAAGQTSEVFFVSFSSLDVGSTLFLQITGILDPLTEFVEVVPEPSTATMGALVLGALAARRRRR